MSDYLVWAAEEMEKRWGWNYDDAVEYLMSNNHIPDQVSMERYNKEVKKDEQKS